MAPLFVMQKGVPYIWCGLKVKTIEYKNYHIFTKAS
ncbi:hypothetical protein SAMN05444481_10578 [Flavobacterium frigidimaris]|jgi:hypothetical protein|nr:hypothetical protein SAMN05444481_10578 [Flavobacterium frigidimaris]